MGILEGIATGVKAIVEFVPFVVKALGGICHGVRWLFRRAIGYRKRNIFHKFWGKPKGLGKKVHIYYPGYAIAGVGRTEKETGNYVSADDARAVDMLKQALREMGYDLDLKTDADMETQQRFPDEGTIVLVCGPKIDKQNGKVSYDPMIGGNRLSSRFFLKHHRRLSIDLRYNNGRKEYTSPDGTTMHSPMDDAGGFPKDGGLLIRFKDGKRLFILCWGIHAPGTLGTVQAAITPEELVRLPLDKDNIIAHVTATFSAEGREVTELDVKGSPLTITDDITLKKPDPFDAPRYIDEDEPVFGLSYLWATSGNITAVKSGNYANLRPVAAELDLSLDCVYKCPYCAYKIPKSKLPSHVDSILKKEMVASEFIARLHDFGIQFVVLTGGGEPLMSPCVERIVDDCIKCNMRVTLYTNAFLLDHIRAYHLMSSGITEIRVSLDDVSSPQDYANAHGTKNSSLAIVKENCRRLLDIRRRMSFNTSVGISLLVSDQTVGNLRATVEELKSWVSGVGPFDYAVIKPAVLYRPPNQNSEQYFTQHNIKIIRDIAEYLKTNGVVRHSLVSWQRFKDVHEDPCRADYNRCLAASLWLNVVWNGSAYVCCETKYDDDYLIGNIQSSNIDELIANRRFQDLQDPDNIMKGCPVRMCKPSAINRLLNNIEGVRGNGAGLPGDVIKWLNELARYNIESPAGNIMIPSVSGIYEEVSSV